MRTIGRLLTLVALVTLSAVPALADDARPAVIVEATRAETGRPTRLVRTAGEIVPVRSVIVRNEVAGLLTEIAFSDGGTVAEGDLLATLSDRRYQTEVSEYTAAYTAARQSYDRARRLTQTGYGKKADTDRTQAEMLEAAAMLERAKIDLAQTGIRAPFGGVLGIRRAHEGQFLTAGSDIVNLEDVSRLLVHFRLPQRYLGQVKAGDEFTVTTAQTGDRSFAARVDAVDPELDTQSRTLRIKGIISEEDADLRPGQFVTVSLDLVAGPEQVFVPEAAVVYNGGKQLLVKVVDGRSRPVPVKTGDRFDGLVAVTGDVADGDIVVVAGQQKVAAGDVPVEVVEPSFLWPSSSSVRIVGGEGH